MKLLDPGHLYSLEAYDGPCPQTLRFLKREGIGYPGNTGSYAGTNCQEVIRALIDRVKYLDGQEACNENSAILGYLRRSLYLFERRASIRHGRAPRYDAFDETIVPCSTCGHISCEHLDMAAQ